MKNFYIFASLLILASCATGSGGNQTLKNESESSVTTKIINNVTTQSEILNIFNDLQKGMGISIVLISHNIGVIAETSDRVMVMKGGKVVEKGSTFDVLTSPKDEYTKHLLSCIPPWLEG